MSFLGERGRFYFVSFRSGSTRAGVLDDLCCLPPVNQTSQIQRVCPSHWCSLFRFGATKGYLFASTYHGMPVSVWFVALALLAVCLWHARHEPGTHRWHSVLPISCMAGVVVSCILGLVAYRHLADLAIQFQFFFKKGKHMMHISSIFHYCPVNT